MQSDASSIRRSRQASSKERFDKVDRQEERMSKSIVDLVGQQVTPNGRVAGCRFSLNQGRQDGAVC